MAEPYHDGKVLRELYHDKGLSQKEIAEKFGVKSNTISQWMTRNDITTRPFEDKPYKKADVLRFLHYDEDLTTTEIGDKFGISRETVRHWMQKHKIPRKDPNRNRYDIPESELRRLYVDEKKSAYECADYFGCTAPVIRSRLDDYGIPVRNSSQAQRVNYGEYVSLKARENGYRRWHDQISGKEVLVHQLLAIAHGADPYDVFGGGTHCHHRNRCRFDNRSENIETLTNSEHMKLHQNGVWTEENGYPVLALPDDLSQ